MSQLTDSRSDLSTALAALPELNGVPIEEAWVPAFRREDIATLRVVVAPESYSCKQRCRDSNSYAITFSIAVMQPLDPEQTDQQATQNLAIADSICTLLGFRIGGSTNAAVTGVEVASVASETHWREYNLASTFLAVTLEF
ncbi:MAG TPA: hypothetical protein DDW52_10200 [Planctomycetaceae bacterium]|nr:hypothetical protein [Planctomycetaceae bacterium]